MLLITLLTLLCNIAYATATMATGQFVSFNALKQLMERQIDICVPVRPPYTCARSCGSGSTECVSFPTCYNPSRGDVCCSDGTYCSSGTYCTNAGCCRNGTPLDRCGATISLSIIPPKVETTTAISSVPTITPTLATTTSTTTEVSSTAEETSTSTTESSELTDTALPTDVTPTTTTTSTEPPSETSASSSSTSPVQVAPGAGQKLDSPLLQLGIAVVAVLSLIM